MANDPALSRRLRKVKHIVLVLSGKGGVGKSSVSVQLALSLLNRGKGAQVGLLDIDLTGPSIPRMLGLEGRSVLQSTDGWIPVHTGFKDHLSTTREASEKTLKCMSIGFLLKDPKDSVVWRGPKKNAMIRQFLVDVRWGELDYLIIDTPPGPSSLLQPTSSFHVRAAENSSPPRRPGTSDEHISLLEQLAPLLTRRPTSSTAHEPLPSLSSVLVTTPQAVSLLDVSKEYDFTQKTGLKVIGLIENMSGYLCPHCGQIQNIFGSGGGVDFCRKKSNQQPNVDGSNQQQGLTFLGKIPIDIEFMKLMDQAMDSHLGGLSSAEPHQPPNPSSPTQNSELINRYFTTKTSHIFGEICDKIVQATESLE